jgi:hypothetical protein
MILVSGLYSGLASRPPRRKRLFFAGGGQDFPRASRIFWRFPTALLSVNECVASTQVESLGCR